MTCSCMDVRCSEHGLYQIVSYPSCMPCFIEYKGRPKYASGTFDPDQISTVCHMSEFSKKSVSVSEFLDWLRCLKMFICY